MDLILMCVHVVLHVPGCAQHASVRETFTRPTRLRRFRGLSWLSDVRRLRSVRSLVQEHKSS